jgi:putative ABC transport system permease protein
MPYGDPDRLVMVWMDNQRMKVSEDIHSYPNYVDYRDQNQTFESIAAYSGMSVNLIGWSEPERLIGSATTANLFDILRVDPLLGRVYSVEEEQPGHDQVVVISYSLWQRRFGGSQDILGQTINLSDVTRTVIGVMPPGFKFPHKDAELWVPLAAGPQQQANRGGFYLYAIGRLKPAVTLEQARADMGGIAENLQRQYPQILDGYGVNLVPLHQQVVGEVRPALIVMLVAVGFVLLIACANVANLLLARAASRQREIAMRAALGAKRGRLVRQLLTESSVLAIIGGAVGLLIAYLGLRALIRISPPDVPRLNEIGIDWRVLVFTLGVSLLTGLFFGIAPALQSSRTDLNEALKEGGRTSTGVHGKRLRSGLVVIEIALSLMLLIGAGLLIKSFARLQELDLGFNPDRILTMNLQLTRSRYQGGQGAEFYRQLIERVQGLPGVESAGATTAIFIGTLPNSSNFTVEGKPPAAVNEQIEAPIDFVTPGYFRAMQIPLLMGRELTEQDDTQKPRVALVNKTFADRFFANEDPIGKRFKFAPPDVEAPWITIVGVVGDMRRTGYEAAVRCETFLPYTQRSFMGFMTLVVRTTSDPSSMIPAVRDVVKEIDPNQPISHVMTMDQMLGEMTARRRLIMTLLAVFAIVAVVLAGVGIYGVMSYSVAQRTHELGVRIALGAGSSAVFGLILRYGLAMIVAGVVIGLTGAYFLMKLMTSLLFEVSATDLAVFALVPVLLSGIALVSCLIPARRAMSVDPMVALRYE